MDLFDLTAQVTIDTAPFESALARMESSSATLVTVLRSALAQARSAASSGGYAVGTAIASGIRSGVTASSSSVYAAVTNLCAGLVAAAKSELGIASPSRVFASLGRYMTEGLTEGLTAGLSDTRAALADGLDSLTQAGFLRAELDTGAGYGSSLRTEPAADSAGRGIDRLLEEYLPKIAARETGVYLDGQRLSTALAPDMNEALGRLRELEG